MTLRTRPASGPAPLPRRALATVLVALLSGACGRVGYEPWESAVADAGASQATCAVLGPWEEPIELSIGGTATATRFGGPAPSADRLGLAFSMELAGGSEDIYYATRTDPESSSFGIATRMDDVSTPGVEGTPVLSPSGQTIYFFAESGSGGAATRDIYYATRSSGAPSDSFSVRTLLPNVNDTGLDHGPKFTAGGRALVFSSVRAGSSGEDLYLAERTSTTDDFGAVRRVAELATSGAESGGSLSPNGRRLYFVSDRDGTTGDLDVWVASRADRTGQFGGPTNVTPVNSAAAESDTAISSDEQELFFVSTRGGAPRLWHSLRRCLR